MNPDFNNNSNNYYEYFNHLHGHNPLPSTSASTRRRYVQPGPQPQQPVSYPQQFQPYAAPSVGPGPPYPYPPQPYSNYNSIPTAPSYPNPNPYAHHHSGGSGYYHTSPNVQNLQNPNTHPASNYNYKTTGAGYGNTFVAPHPKDPQILDDEDFSEKLIAYARFNRNTDLMKEVLSDEIVPVQNPVMKSRLETLKEQVRGLEGHKKKMDEELKAVEKVCTTRKRKFLESTKAYHTKYNKYCKPVDDQMYNNMVDHHYKILKRQAEMQHQWEQTLEWAHQTAVATSPVESGDSTPALAEILGIPEVKETRKYESRNNNEDFQIGINGNFGDILPNGRLLLHPVGESNADINEGLNQFFTKYSVN